jgi:hypothetical protein
MDRKHAGTDPFDGRVPDGGIEAGHHTGDVHEGDDMADNELSPAAKALIAARTWTAQEWAESQAEVDAENEERGRKLFGDGERFFIPDTETNS